MTSLKNLFLASLALCALGLLITPRVAAQDKKPEGDKKTETPEGEKQDSLVGTAKIRYEGLIFVDATVNGKGPYNFMFDSGASMTVLSTRLARELDIKVSEDPLPAGGVGTAEMHAAIAKTITVAGFTRTECGCGVTSFDHISGELGKHMMGIIGQNMIKFMKRVEFDFSKSTMTVTRYPDGEGPNPDDDMQENGIRGIARGEGMPGIPGIPGMPGGRKQPKKEPKKDEEKPKSDDEKEDGFSVGPNAGFNWLGDEKKTETAPSGPTDALSFKFRHMELDMGVAKMELAAMWFINIEINGKKVEMFFDTGATSLCVLDDDEAKALGVTTSYSFSVKGLGESTGSEGMLESIKLGTLTIKEPSVSVIDLSAALGQMEMLKPMLERLPNKPAGLNTVGLIGLPIATRFKKMTVDCIDRIVTLTPYGKGETNAIDPVEGEGVQREAVIRTWNGQAAKCEFDGETVMLDDWEKLGLKSGGMRVSSVSGAAEKAGLRVGDYVTGIAGQGEPDEKGAKADMPVRGMASLVMWACLQDPGSKHTFRVKRGDKTLDIEMTLADYGWKGDAPEKYRRK